MPEGPSIVILKEEALQFKGKKVIKAFGNAKIDISRIEGRSVLDFLSWGKHFLICFDDFYLRVHLLMFGSYRINEQKETAPRLSMKFKKGEFNLYTCSVKLFEGKPENDYDWQRDTMSDEWNPELAFNSLKRLKEMLVCDALLSQEIFAGVGNIIKNEVLFITEVHPEVKIKDLPDKKLKEIIRVTRDYCFDFYKWKKAYVLKKHWLIYNKSICPRCETAVKREYLGITKRRTSFCPNCQMFYKSSRKSKKK